MSDWQSWRASQNVQIAPTDALRRLWLGEAAMAPDDYRASWGLSSLTPQTRETIGAFYGKELPVLPEGRDYFGQGRGVTLPEPDPPLAPLGRPSLLHQTFRQQNDAALLAQDVNGMLGGQSSGSDPYEEALVALMGPQRRVLGQY